MKAGTSSQKLILFIRGKAMSGAPIISGTNQLPKPPIIAGMTMKKTMIRPWAVISTFHRWLASSTLAPVPAQASRNWIPGCGQLGAHQPRDRAADDPGDDREDQIEGADVLVVGRHEPAHEEAGLVIGVVMGRMGAVRLEMRGVGSRVGHVSFRGVVGRRPGWSPAGVAVPGVRVGSGVALGRARARRRRGRGW